MGMPRPSSGVTQRFLELLPDDPRVTQRKVFGQPAAFVHGRMFFATFGESLVVRLSDDDRIKALARPGFRIFEPMPGRPMRAFVVLPAEVVANGRDAGRWIRLALAEAASGPAPRDAKPRSPARRAAVRRARPG
jgi:hypothetical protein